MFGIVRQKISAGGSPLLVLLLLLIFYVFVFLLYFLIHLICSFYICYFVLCNFCSFVCRLLGRGFALRYRHGEVIHLQQKR